MTECPGEDTYMHAYVGHTFLYMGVAKSNHTLPPFLSVLSTPAPTASLSVFKEQKQRGGGTVTYKCVLSVKIRTVAITDQEIEGPIKNSLCKSMDT